jgi:hypothetical protein
MKRVLLILLIFIASTIYPQQFNKIYNNLLKKYVKDGLVDYEQLKKDTTLQTYLDSLSSTNPDSFNNKNQKLAFWINAYNAFTLKIIVDNYPINSINDLNWGGMIISQILGKTVWDKKFIRINKTKYSLNDIEHGIISKKFNDPRVHFSLVCASLSCPRLRSEVYTPDKLDSQLIEQGKLFLNNPDKNRYDLQNRVAHISKLFNWYKSDFGKSNKEILLYISNYLNNPAIVKSIRENPDKWAVEYLPYNWCLNDKGAKFTDNRCVFDFDTIKGWFLGLGDKYNVNPWIFGGIYVGAIPFFTFCIGWIIKNYKRNKSIVLPSILAGFFFISAYLYLIIAGEHVPWWVYSFLVLMTVYGIYSTVNKIKHKVEEKDV